VKLVSQAIPSDLKPSGAFQGFTTESANHDTRGALLGTATEIHARMVPVRVVSYKLCHKLLKWCEIEATHLSRECVVYQNDMLHGCNAGSHMRSYLQSLVPCQRKSSSATLTTQTCVPQRLSFVQHQDGFLGRLRFVQHAVAFLGGRVLVQHQDRFLAGLGFGQHVGMWRCFKASRGTRFWRRRVLAEACIGRFGLSSRNGEGPSRRGVFRNVLGRR